MKALILISFTTFFAFSCKSKNAEVSSESKAIMSGFEGSVIGFSQNEKREEGTFNQFLFCYEHRGFIQSLRIHFSKSFDGSCGLLFEVKEDAYKAFMKDLSIELKKMSLNGKKAKDLSWLSCNLRIFGLAEWLGVPDGFELSACDTMDLDTSLNGKYKNAIKYPVKGEDYIEFLGETHKIRKVNVADFNDVWEAVESAARRHQYCKEGSRNNGSLCSR